MSNGHWILRNLLWACIFLFVVIGGASLGLRIITQHSKQITVPDFTEMTVDDASLTAASLGLSIVPIDSVFMPRMEKGAIFSQNPRALSKVKSGRKIRVIINATVSKTVVMPDLVGLSMRQAKSELDSRGLKLGKLLYVSDMATNNVLRQTFKGEEVEPGEEIFSGSVIDLTLGLNDNENITLVPDVRGMKYSIAIGILKESSLNVGRARFDRSVETYVDSLEAVVFYQNPEPRKKIEGEEGEEDTYEPVSAIMGSEVSLSLTLDKNKVPGQWK